MFWKYVQKIVLQYFSSIFNLHNFSLTQHGYDGKTESVPIEKEYVIRDTSIKRFQKVHKVQMFWEGHWNLKKKNSNDLVGSKNVWSFVIVLGSTQNIWTLLEVPRYQKELSWTWYMIKVHIFCEAHKNNSPFCDLLRKHQLYWSGLNCDSLFSGD